MATTGGTKVELRDGHTWELRYRTPDLIKMQRAVSEIVGERTPFAGVFARLQGLDIEVLCAVVWAGLLHAEPEIKVDTVAERIAFNRIDHVSEKAVEAIRAAMPKKLRDDADEEATDEGNETPTE